jgi:hypothetical protein
MENQTERAFINERKAFIEAAYAEKKGREVNVENPYVCYINLDSSSPYLPSLTASLLETLEGSVFEACSWTGKWDKSIISIAPDGKAGCAFMRSDDLHGKVFVPVSTTKVINPEEFLKTMPKGDLAFIGINNQPMTIDSFLITYFHMVNELIWDTAIKVQGQGRVNPSSYGEALRMVIANGFEVGLVSETEIIQTKKQDPDTSVRIYGSNVNRFVPEILGAIIKT